MVLSSTGFYAGATVAVSERKRSTSGATYISTGHLSARARCVANHSLPAPLTSLDIPAPEVIVPMRIARRMRLLEHLRRRPISHALQHVNPLAPPVHPAPHVLPRAGCVVVRGRDPREAREVLPLLRRQVEHREEVAPHLRPLDRPAEDVYLAVGDVHGVVAHPVDLLGPRRGPPRLVDPAGLHLAPALRDEVEDGDL